MNEWQEKRINYIVVNKTEKIESAIKKEYKVKMLNDLLLFPLYQEISLIEVSEESMTKIDAVICAGDGKQENPLPCDYKNVLKLANDCKKLNKNFIFRDTGSLFRMDDKLYHIPRGVSKNQAQKANVDFYKSKVDKELYSEENLWERLAKSKFRSKFKLSLKDKEYTNQKGQEQLRAHAYNFVEKRLAPKNPKNDGRQTPLKGHPVFIAQHATGTCCRGCLEKWHRISQQKQLDENEKNYICDVILEWINRQME